MTTPRTLNELTDLKNARFGRPNPRYGLKLLYWFANEFLSFNNNNKMCWRYNPKFGDFGFHRFKNIRDANGVKLLPDVQLPYYVLGNLNSPGADELPEYIREDYDNGFQNCNMDRIIVSINNKCVEKVYVTEHSNQTDFNKQATFCISRGLIMIIKRLTLEDFLSKTGYSVLQRNTYQMSEEDDSADSEVTLRLNHTMAVVCQPRTPEVEEQCCKCSPCTIL